MPAPRHTMRSGHVRPNISSAGPAPSRQHSTVQARGFYLLFLLAGREYLTVKTPMISRALLSSFCLDTAPNGRNMSEVEKIP